MKLTSSSIYIIKKLKPPFTCLLLCRAYDSDSLSLAASFRPQPRKSSKISSHQNLLTRSSLLSSWRGTISTIRYYFNICTWGPPNGHVATLRLLSRPIFFCTVISGFYFIILWSRGVQPNTWSIPNLIQFFFLFLSSFSHSLFATLIIFRFNYF